MKADNELAKPYFADSFSRIRRTYRRQVSRKTVAKSLADGVVQLAILGVYTRTVNYDSATVQ